MAEKIHANMNVVNKLLEIITDWQNIVNPRHVKFILAYENSNRNILKAGQDFNFTKNDMLSIFLRIESTLKDEYDKRVREGTLKKINLYYSADRKVVYLNQFIPTYETVFKIDGVSEKRKEQIEAVLKVASKVKNLDQILLPSHVAIVKDLIKGKSFNDVLSIYGRSREYTSMLLIGKKNPRYPSEQGILSFIEKAAREGKIKH